MRQMLGGAFFAQKVITEHKILGFFLVEIIWLQTGKDHFRRLQLVIVRLCLFISYTTEKNLINAGETILVEIGHVVCIGFINIPISNKVLNECKVFASFDFAKIIFCPDFIGNRQAENLVNVFSGYNRSKRSAFNLLEGFFVFDNLPFQ